MQQIKVLEMNFTNITSSELLYFFEYTRINIIENKEEKIAEKAGKVFRSKYGKIILTLE